MPAQTASNQYVENSAHAHVPSANEVVTFSPGQQLPPELNGIAFSPWRPSPFTPEVWASVATADNDFHEPAVKIGAALAATVIVLESDSRVWMIHTNESFSAKQLRFPTTRKDAQLSLLASAVRETWEKTGLKVHVNGVLGDIDDGHAITRYYIASRVGGAPTMTGWKCPSVSLVPLGLLHQAGELLGATLNRNILAALQTSLEMLQAMREAKLNQP